MEEGSLDAFYDPIPADFFRFPTFDVPSVSVSVNGITAACNDINVNNSVCGFSFVQSLTPTVASISTASPAAVLPGQTFQITGTGFGTNPADITVLFGSTAACNLVSVTNTNIVCTAADYKAGAFAVSVLHATRGLATVPSTTFTFASVVTSVQPLLGGPVGGNTLTITGTGFVDATSLNVQIGGRPCAIVTSTFSLITCTVPAASDNVATTASSAGVDSVASITIGGLAYTHPQSYAYSWAAQPVVSAVVPSAVSAGVTTTITISGSFSVHQNTSDCELIVSVGTQTCVSPVLIDASTIKCTLVRGPAQPINLQQTKPAVFLCTAGQHVKAHVEPSVFVDQALRITAISPKQVSLAGGTIVTITGVGFISSLLGRMHIIINNPNAYQYVVCSVQNSTYTTAICKTNEFTGSTLSSVVNGVLVLDINGVEAVCTDCAISASATTTPAISSINPASGYSGTLITLSGRQLSSSTTQVKIGTTACTNVVAAGDGLSATCTVPALAAGAYTVSISDSVLGSALSVSGANVTFTSLLRIDSIAPQVGSLSGGTSLTIQGAGFSTSAAENIVYLRAITSSAVVLQSSYSTLVVATPSITATANTTSNVSVIVNTSSYGNMSQTCANCLFVYTPQVTATITTINPTSGTQGTVLRVQGTGFGTVSATSSMLIGNVPCVINATTYSNTLFFCTVGATPAGSHSIFLTVDNKGTAKTTLKFTSLLTVSSFTPSSGSYGGGQTVTITGSGFGSSVDGSLAYFCGVPCTVVSSSYNTVTCVTTPITTIASLQAFNNVNPSPLPGVAAGNALLAFDTDFATQASTCPVSYDFGAMTLAYVTRVNFLPVPTNAAVMAGGVFEVSRNGTFWATAATITAAQPGWNTIDITLSEPVRFIRYRNANNNCQVVELQFIGIATAVTVLNGAGQPSCQVNVSVVAPPNHPSLGYNPFTPPALSQSVDNWGSGGLSVLGALPGVQAAMQPAVVQSVVPSIFSSALCASQTFTPLINQTAVVTSVIPAWGTALGGTVITISGVNLPSLVANAAVTVNGMPCSVLTAFSTVITCTTSRRTSVQPQSLVVAALNGNGSPNGYSLSTASLLFAYLDRWSAPTTWGNQELPAEGDMVVIPEGQSVLMDMSPPELWVLVVQGTLVFADADLELTAGYIFVPGGKFQIGTEQKPYLNKAVITLTGDRMTTIELPEIGSKVLAVSNKNLMVNPGAATKPSDVGVLDIHGAPRLRTWIKLAATANAGASTIIASDDVDFVSGEEIVVTSSNFGRAERVTVVAVDSTRRAINITPALKFTHESTITTIDGQQVDLRAEVGLLTRNIVIQSQGATTYEQMFGVHVTAVRGGIVRLENAELRNCGKANNVGRSCVDLRLLPLGSLSYVRFNSIHDSFQRGVTISSSNNINVKHNFVYKAVGHGFALDTGGEMYNTFDENLVSSLIPTLSLLYSERQPACFFTMSPLNTWRNNVGVDGYNGFFFTPFFSVIGPLSASGIVPARTPIVQFSNNTARGNLIHGLHFWSTYMPVTNPSNWASASAPQYFTDFVAFRNGNNGVFAWRLGDVHFVRSKLIENGREEFVQIYYSGVPYSTNANVQQLLAVGSLTGQKQRQGIITPQNEFFYVSGATFVNYGTAGAIGGCAACASLIAQGGYTVRFDGLRFVNVVSRVGWNPPLKDIFKDLDGTLTGFINGTALPYYAFNDRAGCTRANQTFQFGSVCVGTVPVRRLQIDAVNPSQLDFQTLRLFGVAGNDTVNFLPTEIYGWAVPVAANTWVRGSFVSPADWTRIRLRYSEPEYVEAGEWLGVSMGYLSAVSQFMVTYSDTNTQLASVNDPTYTLNATTPFGASRVNTITRVLEFMLSTSQGVDTQRSRFPGPYSLVASPIFYPINSPLSDMLNVPAVQVLNPGLKWSDPATWPNNIVPKCSDDVQIPVGKEIELDISPCLLNSVTVYGKLVFSDERDITLQSFRITVYGYLTVGTADKPYQHNAKIQLFGVSSSPFEAVAGNINIGNKALAVFGRLDMYGINRVGWVKLATTALPGDVTLNLASPCDWAAGDIITISSTEYDANEVETMAIASVSSDGLTVNLTSTLSFRHFAGQITDASGTVTTLAAVVGLLTRNVVLEGSLKGLTDMSGLSGILTRRMVGQGSIGSTDTYGAHLYVGDVTMPNGEVLRGSARVNSVSFRFCGKMGTQFPAVKYEYRTLGSVSNSSLWPVNFVSNSSFQFAFNQGVWSLSSRGVSLTNNVFHRTYGSTVEFDGNSVGASVVNNAVIGNYRSPSESKIYVRPFASFFFNTLSLVSVRNNVVGGTQDAGFTYFGEACNVRIPVFANNEVHSALVGHFLLNGGSGCSQVSQTLVWKIAHIGVLSLDQQANVLVRNVTIADSHIGVSINYFRSGAGIITNITDSRIYGSTSASTCASSITCRAVSNRDPLGAGCNSVFGTSYRRVGIVAPQFLNRAKTCGTARNWQTCRPVNTPGTCGMPWEARIGLPHTANLGETVVTRTSFGFFSKTDCGLTSVAVALNPSQVDYSPSFRFAQIRWTSTAMDARLSLGLTRQHPAQCNGACDAVNLALASDADGSFSNTRGAIVSQENPLLAYSSPRCTAVPDFKGIMCPNMSLVSAVFENQDLDRGIRSVGPVLLTKLSPVENRSTFSVGNFNDPCSVQVSFGQFPMLMEPGQTYFMYTVGSMPSNTRITYTAPSANDVVLLNIFFQQPYSLQVLVNGAVVAPSTTYPTLASPKGANVFDPQARRLWLVLRGDPSTPQVFDIRTQSTIQLSMAVSVTQTQFFGDALVANLAMLLGIPPSRIVIADVQPLAGRRRRDDVPDPVLEIPTTQDPGFFVMASTEQPTVAAVEDNTTNTQANNATTTTTTTTTAAPINVTGNVQLSITILPPAAVEWIAANDSALQSSLQDQASIIQKVETAASSGALKSVLQSSGTPLAGNGQLTIGPPPGMGAEASTSYSVPVKDGSSSKSEDPSAAIGGAVGGVAVCVIVVALLVARSRKNAQAAKAKNNSPAELQAVFIGASTRESDNNNDAGTSSGRPSQDLTTADDDVSHAAPAAGTKSKAQYLDIGDNAAQPDEVFGSQDSLVETDLGDVGSKGSFLAQMRSRSAHFLSAVQQLYEKPKELACSISHLQGIAEFWAHPEFSRKQALRILENYTAGAFMLYNNEGLVEIAVRLRDKVLHFPILYVENGDQSYKLGVLNNQAWHANLTALVQSYMVSVTGVPFVLSHDKRTYVYTPPEVESRTASLHSIEIATDEDPSVVILEPATVPSPRATLEQIPASAKSPPRDQRDSLSPRAEAGTKKSPLRRADSKIMKAELFEKPKEIACSARHLESIQEHWCRPDLSRRAAIKSLNMLSEGAFAVYSNDGLVELAVRLRDKVLHFPILLLEEDGKPTFKLGVFNGQAWHPDIQTLVRSYQLPQHGVPFILSYKKYVLMSANSDSSLI